MTDPSGAEANASSETSPQVPSTGELVYLRAVLSAYRATPGTSGFVRPADRRLARDLCARGVSLQTVNDALLLASARRFARTVPPSRPPTVRSLAYFQGAIEEVLHEPLEASYRRYLERTLADALAAFAASP